MGKWVVVVVGVFSGGGYKGRIVSRPSGYGLPILPVALANANGKTCLTPTSLKSQPANVRLHPESMMSSTRSTEVFGMAAATVKASDPVTIRENMTERTGCAPCVSEHLMQAGAVIFVVIAALSRLW